MIKMIPELKNKRPTVIYGILKRLGIKPKRKIVLTDKQRNKRKIYTVNENYFSIIDSEDKAYWLGFIYADGYITSASDKIGITLSYEDKEHLELFSKCISSTYPIKEYIQYSGFSVGNKFCRILISSRKMKQDLKDKGVSENKTTIIKFPSEKQVPRNLLNHFIRGYLDGDGSITTHSKTKNNKKNYSIKICGTCEFIEGFKKTFGLSIKKEQRYGDRNVNNYSLTIAGNKQVLKILNSIYKNSNFYLKRKYNKYIELINQSN